MDDPALGPRPSFPGAAALVLAGGVLVLGASALAHRAGPAAAAGLLVALALCARARRARRGDREAALGALAVAAASVLSWAAGTLSDALVPAPATSARAAFATEPLPADDLAWAGLAFALLAPAASAARVLRQPWHALLRPPRPVGPALVAAAAAAAVLLPIASAADLHGRAVVASLVGVPGPDARLPAVLGASAVGPPAGGGFGPTWLWLALVLPALEVLLHGVVRRAAEGVRSLPFVVATAVAAPVLLAPAAPAPGVFVAALVTGALARRTESVLPGIVFWQALAASEALWRPLA